MSFTRYANAAAFILAGGQSTRMGQDKAWLQLGAVPLVVRTVRLVEPLVSAVTIIGPPARFQAVGLAAIPDRVSGRATSEEVSEGPLAGIVTALQATRYPWNLVLACDLPYLSGEWVHWLLGRATVSKAQVVTPQRRSGIEPLTAVYRKDCEALLSAALARGVRKVSDALAGLPQELLAETEWCSLDPDGDVLDNMNTPADYARARRHWENGARSGG
jgi:molybdopterin-guanine dinucleotide biosynthesis protein A